APTEISTLSLHDALPILGATFKNLVKSIHLQVILILQRGITCQLSREYLCHAVLPQFCNRLGIIKQYRQRSLNGLEFLFSYNWRSEEHTSELQSRENLVC